MGGSCHCNLAPILTRKPVGKGPEPLSDQSQPQIKGAWAGGRPWKMGPLMAPQTVGLCNAAHKSLRNTEFCPRMEVRKLRKRSLFQKGGRSDPATNRESSGAWRLYADMMCSPMVPLITAGSTPCTHHVPYVPERGYPDRSLLQVQVKTRRVKLQRARNQIYVDRMTNE